VVTIHHSSYLRWIFSKTCLRSQRFESEPLGAPGTLGEEGPEHCGHDPPLLFMCRDRLSKRRATIANGSGVSWTSIAFAFSREMSNPAAKTDFEPGFALAARS
jgi:hypothetical protein